MKEIITIRSIINKLYGGLNMSWLTVILFALGTAVLTSIFLIVPFFHNTSFELMGVDFEAWFFFAIIIMANCKKPLESALKTFVFFLISQPLIYLIQVPFSSMGWGLFGYYKYWFLWTLLTFPMAFVGWFITKKNWLSVIILTPVLAFMGSAAYQSGLHCIRLFPYRLVTSLFCLLQIVLYVIAFFPDIKKKLVGILIPLIIVVVFTVTTPQVDVNGTVFLPDDLILSDSAVVVTEDDPAAAVTIESTGEDSMIRVHASQFGATDFTIRDGEAEYLYTAEVYEDDTGHPQIQITKRKKSD